MVGPDLLTMFQQSVGPTNDEAGCINLRDDDMKK